MTKEEYEKVAEAYQTRHGEPLVAGEDWVGTIYEICQAGVECDPAIGPNFDLTPEIVNRTADVIATITHGGRAMRQARPAPINEHLYRATRRWGLRAARQGLVIVDADDTTITVSDPLFGAEAEYVIHELVLSRMHNNDWAFQEAARTIAARAQT